MRVSNIKSEVMEGPDTDSGMVSFDGNEAAAWVAYRLTEVCAIYPITPSSTMAELGRPAPCTERCRPVPCRPPSRPHRA
jgi:hypothetical protein